MHSGPMRGYWKWLAKKFKLQFEIAKFDLLLREHEMMMWASAQWSNEGLLEMINEKVSSLIWNSKIWLAAEGAWDDDVIQCTVVSWGVIENDWWKSSNFNLK